MPNNVTLLIGTTKGLFLAAPDPSRETWGITGPLCGGWPINHAIGDPATGRIWAAGGGDWNGAGVWRSEDAGATWELSQLAHGQMQDWIAENPDEATAFGFEPAPPAPYTGEVTALWSLGRANGQLYAGAKPATLFESPDGGESWSRVDALTDHPSRPDWQPGGAGLILHTIVPDPDDAARLWVSISAAGTFATEDGGQSWTRRNRRSNAGATVPVEPGHDHGADVGTCVHNLVRAPGSGQAGDLLYQQNHHGVFRSRDGGRSWDDISAGLPSTFGFPIAVHPRDPERIWVLPLNGDSIGRYPPGASAAVWASADGGTTWQAERAGLPQSDCYFTVLRQAMATDHAPEVGVYFGTNSGSVFRRSSDGVWDEIARHLPTILSVETMTA
ncbi:WD40/YVTN/BNR-like repeat-containing protein [Ovoidimarina sediminis]|uniref:WD40/YVTN/BNR-like repeat-containing protein n=1 Tax=Ovoidimarina sediminis TaxID=3079856 RepID=UPI00290B45E5|nr:sialidase family protein [Rhodophyticola sp. MJ-SS7]MDU8943294.1 sialidase family protein [Rhodophyticola sp. MJ-SS7]